jgi:hypothetical protein
MEPQPPPPHSVPSYIYVFKVLDHCGCLICATYFDNTITNLEYYSACDNCCNNLSYQHYADIYHMCTDELQRYSIKELIHHRGWINKHEASKILLKSKINSNRSNAKLLTIRMGLVAPCAEKIEHLNDTYYDVNPS